MQHFPKKHLCLPHECHRIFVQLTKTNKVVFKKINKLFTNICAHNSPAWTYTFRLNIVPTEFDALHRYMPSWTSARKYCPKNGGKYRVPFPGVCLYVYENGNEEKCKYFIVRN